MYQLNVPAPQQLQAAGERASVALGMRGVDDDELAHQLGVLTGQAVRQCAAPIVPQDGDSAITSRIAGGPARQRRQVFERGRRAVRLEPFRLVREPVALEIGRDRAKAFGGERFAQLAKTQRRIRKAVEQQHGLAVSDHAHVEHAAGRAHHLGVDHFWYSRVDTRSSHGKADGTARFSK
jgi:hypothetical protein